MLHRTLVAGVLLTVASIAHAQTATDPSGHWEGHITAPFGEIPIVLDIARRDGELVATFTRQDGSISGFPLSDVELNAQELKMTLKANGGGTMRGSIEGTRITGTFAAFAGTAPFVVTRTGDARFTPAPVNKAVSHALEGTWTARVGAGADSTTFLLTIRNQSNGTATATIADEHGVEVPLKVQQDAADVTIDIPTAHSTFTGTLKADGSAIEGNYKEGPLNAPVTFSKVR